MYATYFVKTQLSCKFDLGTKSLVHDKQIYWKTYMSSNFKIHLEPTQTFKFLSVVEFS